MEGADCLIAVAVQELLWCRPNISFPGRLNMGFVPAIVSVQAGVRGAKFGKLTNVARCRFANNRPVPAESGPAACHVVGAPLHMPGSARGAHVAGFRMI